jgi:hypothetical protein
MNVDVSSTQIISNSNQNSGSRAKQQHVSDREKKAISTK